MILDRMIERARSTFAFGFAQSVPGAVSQQQHAGVGTIHQDRQRGAACVAGRGKLEEAGQLRVGAVSGSRADRQSVLSLTEREVCRRRAVPGGPSVGSFFFRFSLRYYESDLSRARDRSRTHTRSQACL